MIDLDESERAFLVEMRALTTDSNGQEVFVGLTAGETSYYLSYTKRALIGGTDSSETDRYLELHTKHEAARLSVIFSEVELRTNNNSSH